MIGRFRGFDRATSWAMVGAAAIGAQYIAGKAARDALFLGHFEPTALPRMIIGTSIFSILLVAGSSKMLSKVAPGAYVPAAFAVRVRLADYGSRLRSAVTVGCTYARSSGTTYV